MTWRSSVDSKFGGKHHKIILKKSTRVLSFLSREKLGSLSHFLLFFSGIFFSRALSLFLVSHIFLFGGSLRVVSFFFVELTSTDLCGSLLLEALRRSSLVDQFVVGDLLPSLCKCSFVMRCLPSQFCVVPSRRLGGWKVLVFFAFFFSQ